MSIYVKKNGMLLTSLVYENFYYDGIARIGKEVNPNLLTNSSDLFKWKCESSVLLSLTDDGYYCIRSTGSNSETRWGIYQDITLEPEVTYTFSADVKDRYHIGTTPGSSFAWNTTNNVDSTSAQKYAHTFTATDTDCKLRIYLYGYNKTNGETYIRCPKLEVSSYATPYVEKSSISSTLGEWVNGTILYEY